MKNIILVLFLIISNIFIFGQEKKVNNYKFIVVPEQFNFLKQKDEYKTSSLTKFLLKKNGFTVVLNSEQYPKDLRDNPCSGLKAIVLDKSSMFKVKVIIELRDCSNKILYTSDEGVSKLKEFKKGFQEAIRNAHASMNDITYEPFLLETIEKDKKEIVTANPVLVKEVKEVKLEVELPVINNIEAAQISPINNIALSTTLYAQPKENGFQLINLKPQVVFVILNTSVKGVFVIKDKNGLLYKKGENWIAEFYENGKLIEKKYQVKF
ncbi:MAG: hypothetical protein ACI93N_001651 [Flavobacteriaceae bacterium]|jgi:hypothetical protein